MAAIIIAKATTPKIQCDPVVSLSFCTLSCACSCTADPDRDFISCKPTELNCPDDQAKSCKQLCHCSSDRHISQPKIVSEAERTSEEQWQKERDAVLVTCERVLGTFEKGSIEQKQEWEKIDAAAQKTMRKFGKDTMEEVRKCLQEVEEKKRKELLDEGRGEELVTDLQSFLDHEKKLNVLREKSATAAQVANLKEKVAETNQQRFKRGLHHSRPTLVCGLSEEWLFEGDPEAAGAGEGKYKTYTREQVAELRHLHALHRLRHQHEEGVVIDEKCEGTCLCKCGKTSFVCEDKATCEKAVDSWSKEDCKLGCMCSCGTANQLICNGEKDCKSAVDKCWKWGCDEEKVDL